MGRPSHSAETRAKMSLAHTRHGHHSRDHRSPTYVSWAAMVQRCTDPNHARYPRYGGRGIGINPSWRSFENFLADMGERPQGKTLDRINNDGDYGADNCRWATPSEQAQNRRPRQQRREVQWSA
jgi:hypothetical protein